ncbi:MAG: hypothetical protein WBO24_06700, partial [Nitrospirales bacterium]
LGSRGLVARPSPAADFGGRRALFERSEFARRRRRQTTQGTRRATPRPPWFWVLLPKQKDLACRGETRQYH